MADQDGRNALQLTSFNGRQGGTAAWSPHGKSIAYDLRDDDGRGDIYIIPARGGAPLRITNHPADDLVPSWSRDGRVHLLRVDAQRHVPDLEAVTARRRASSSDPARRHLCQRIGRRPIPLLLQNWLLFGFPVAHAGIRRRRGAGPAGNRRRNLNAQSRATGSISSPHREHAGAPHPDAHAVHPPAGHRSNSSASLQERSPGDDDGSARCAWPRRVTRWANAAVAQSDGVHRGSHVGRELSVTAASSRLTSSFFLLPFFFQRSRAPPPLALARGPGFAGLPSGRSLGPQALFLTPGPPPSCLSCRGCTTAFRPVPVVSRTSARAGAL